MTIGQGREGVRDLVGYDPVMPQAYFGYPPDARVGSSYPPRDLPVPGVALAGPRGPTPGPPGDPPGTPKTGVSGVGRGEVPEGPKTVKNRVLGGPWGIPRGRPKNPQKVEKRPKTAEKYSIKG